MRRVVASAIEPAKRREYRQILALARKLHQHEPGRRFGSGDPKLLKTLVPIVGAIECDRNKTERAADKNEESPTDAESEAFAGIFDGLSVPPEASLGLLWSVSRNRKAETNVWRSRLAVKADAVAKLFDVKATEICWAGLCAGVDATHPAFKQRSNGTTKRQKQAQNAVTRELQSRDDCAFGASLFMAAIGRNRCFLCSSVDENDLPSGLRGIVLVKF